MTQDEDMVEVTARSGLAPAISRIKGLTGGELVYAIGDIHGRYDLLTGLLRQVAEDQNSRLRGRVPILIFCGDYVDRGPDSAKVFSALVWLSSNSEYEFHFLKGNHEDVMVRFIDDPLRAREWLSFGGRETIASYGLVPPSFDDSDLHLLRARDQLLDAMPASHLRLLQRLELATEVGDFVFVHAGVNPAKKLSNQTEHDLLWIRDDFIDASGPFEKIIVHGHSFVSHKPIITEWRIGIDTGAYETGVLTALRLDDGDHGLLSSVASETSLFA